MASWGRWEREQHTCTQKFSAHLKVKFNRYLVLIICFLNLGTLISVHPGRSRSWRWRPCYVRGQLSSRRLVKSEGRGAPRGGERSGAEACAVSQPARQYSHLNNLYNHTTHQVARSPAHSSLRSRCDPDQPLLPRDQGLTLSLCLPGMISVSPFHRGSEVKPPA